MGNPAERGDNQCVETYPSLWQSSRVKTYTTSAATRATLLAQGWRDDGVAFYTATAATVQVWTAHLNNDFLYYASATEVSARSGNSPTPAFFILSTAPDTEAVPLMRVNYSGLCSWSHDELVAGEPMFERISTQGNQPIFEVEWSGLTGPTTLVVEALDQGCPFQGHLSASHVPATGLAHDFVSIADAQAASPTGEVFVNGQHDPASKPHAMAQSTVRVAPSTPEAMDFFDGFSGAGETFSQTKLVDFGAWNLFLGSPTYDVQFYELEAKAYSIGAVMGELWVSYADAGSDTNGKLRITPRTKGTLSATSFLHVTMETDLVSTGRRYPQILVSDQPSPVQDNLPNGTTFILQTFRSWPNVLQMEVCDHRTWDVNHQCPHFTLDTNQPGDGLPWSPHQPVGEHAGVAHLGRLDLYLSTRTAYALLDGQPYGCAQLSVAPAAGPVTVTFGDTLYHSGVDEAIVPTPSPYQFHKSYMLTQTRRQFDNLGFSSGVPAPAWDSTRFPCVSTTMP